MDKKNINSLTFKKALYFLFLSYAFLFAKENEYKLNASIGKDFARIDYFKIGNRYYEYYPAEGLNLNFGASALIPLKDAITFNIGASIGYMDIVLSDEDIGLEYSESQTYFSLVPAISFGKEKIYASVGLGTQIPIDSERTIKIDRYYSQRYYLDSKTIFQAFLSARYKYIGTEFGKVLTFRGTTFTGVSIFINLTEQFKIIPNITYQTNDDISLFTLNVGLSYSL